MSAKKVKGERKVMRKDLFATLEKNGVPTKLITGASLTDLEMLVEHAQAGHMPAGLTAEEVEKVLAIIKRDAGANLTKQRDDEIIPVVMELIAAVGAQKNLCLGSTGNVTPEQAAESYQKLYVEVVGPLIQKHNLKLDDLKFFFEMAQQPFALLSGVTGSTVNQARDNADAKLYGLKSVRDMRIADLDRVLAAAA